MDDINTTLKCDDRGVFYFGDYLNTNMGGALILRLGDPMPWRIFLK